MQITKEESGRVLKLAGPLEINAAEELQNALRDFVCGTTTPIVDLSKVDACDTAMLQLLCSARRTAESAGKHLELVGPSPAILAVSAALGLSLIEANRPQDVMDTKAAQQGNRDAV